MKTVYHLHLNGYQEGMDQAGIDMNFRNPGDLGGGWKHCAKDIEVLGNFVHGICHRVDDHAPMIINRLIITRFTKKNDKDQPQYNGLLGWDGQWDATDVELGFVNSGFKFNKRDKAKLSKFIAKKCIISWKKWDSFK